MRRGCRLHVRRACALAHALAFVLVHVRARVRASRVSVPLSLSLSLSFYTHTHTLSLSLSVCLFVCVCARLHLSAWVREGAGVLTFVHACVFFSSLFWVSCLPNQTTHRFPRPPRSRVTAPLHPSTPLPHPKAHSLLFGLPLVPKPCSGPSSPRALRACVSVCQRERERERERERGSRSHFGSSLPTALLRVIGFGASAGGLLGGPSAGGKSASLGRA